MFKRVFIKSEKKVNEPSQRKSLFKIRCKSQGKCCKMVIDSCGTYNLVPTEMVENPRLKRMNHPTRYKVSWLQKGHQLLVNE